VAHVAARTSADAAPAALKIIFGPAQRLLKPVVAPEHFAAGGGEGRRSENPRV
jgi:hypothetical protein